MRALTMYFETSFGGVTEQIVQALDRTTHEYLGKPTHIEFDQFAWPGSYPLYHVARDCGVLCTKCANENISLTADDTENADPQWSVLASEINYEDDDLFCDNCGCRIPSAYGDNHE